MAFDCDGKYIKIGDRVVGVSHKWVSLRFELIFKNQEYVVQDADTARNLIRVGGIYHSGDLFRVLSKGVQPIRQFKKVVG